jgi:hypothetical protein
MTASSHCHYKVLAEMWVISANTGVGLKVEEG